MLKRIKNCVLASVPCLLLAANALAEQPQSTDVSAGFIPLPPRTVVGKNSSGEVVKQAPHFIALGPHNFRSVLPVSHSAPIENEPVERAEEIHSTAIVPHMSEHEVMTPQQAQQIISLFGADQ